MKREITKVWGITLAIVMAASMLFSAAPVSAGELDWGTFTPFPSTTGNVLTTNLSIGDLAIADDGIMYMVSANNTYVYKSTNAGKSWSKLSENFSANLPFVAVAPDDSDIVATFNGTDVFISKDGGSSWGDLGLPDAGGYTLATMQDLALSNADGSKNYVGVAGDNGTDGSIWWFNIGATAPAWSAADATKGFFATGQDLGLAVAFSPNIASDKVMVAVTAASGGAGNVTFQMASVDTKKWNTDAGFDSYPVNVQNDSTDIDSAAHARLALAPDYLGSDDSMRIAFVGISTAGANAYGGVYRLKDTTDKAIDDDFDVWSIDFDGTTAVAGSLVDTKVRYSSNPLASDPDFSTTSAYKRASGAEKVVTAFKGSDVVAGTSGNMSAFAISTDGAKSFNDISFVNCAGTTLGTMLDVAVSADGGTIYMVTQDAQGLSLWRYVGSWQRVFTKVGDANNYIVRVAPDDAKAVYLSMAGDTTSTTIYYSNTGGDTKWFLRAAKYAIQDLAIESADVGYAAVQGASTVSKTTNSGFTWSTATSTGITGDVSMIRSLGEDKVIIGSDSGYVRWSADGGDSWEGISTKLSGSGNVQVTASGLATNDYVYAATDVAASKVERWQIGQSGTSWKSLEAPLSDARSVYGIALVGGVLYAQTDNGTVSQTLRSLSPTTGEPSSGDWSSMDEAGPAFTATPQALKTSSTILWSVSTNTSALYVFTDTLGATGPTLVSPADGAAVTMNTVSGKSNAVALTWKRLSKGTIYDVKIALDSGFTEVVKSITTSSTTDDPVSVVIGPDTDNAVALSPGTTYYWKVRVNAAGPVKSAWSETRTFKIGTLPEAQPPVIIQQPPAPVINVPPAPAITLMPPQIVLPTPPPAQTITIPPAPAPPAPITPAYIWSIIIIGAILVIAVIVLIVRTRRPV
jgi:hypothetical protein